MSKDQKDETEDQRARRVALGHITSPLLRLAANVMRVVRGAGQPYAVFTDCRAVLLAFDDFQRRTGDLPSDFEIAEILRFELHGMEDRPYREYEIALEQMTRGALQHAAGTLLHQVPHRASGSHEMTDGARRYVKFRADQDAKWALEAREAAATKREAAAEARRRKK